MKCRGLHEMLGGQPQTRGGSTPMGSSVELWWGAAQIRGGGSHRMVGGESNPMGSNTELWGEGA